MTEMFEKENLINDKKISFWLQKYKTNDCRGRYTKIYTEFNDFHVSLRAYCSILKVFD